MKRRSRIVTGFMAAAVTFASLFALAGPKKLNSFSGDRANFYGKCQRDHSKTDHVKQPANPITDSFKTN